MNVFSVVARTSKAPQDVPDPRWTTALAHSNNFGRIVVRYCCSFSSIENFFPRWVFVHSYSRAPTHSRTCMSPTLPHKITNLSPHLVITPPCARQANFSPHLIISPPCARPHLGEHAYCNAKPYTCLLSHSRTHPRIPVPLTST